ncbi:MAG: hypothetical protein ACRDGI_01650 [Candidatus Limnocylindrales bacterium]
MDEPEIGLVEGESQAPASVRERAWTAAGILLLALGAVLLATGLVGLVTGGGGAAFLVLGLPPAGTGFLVHRRVSSVRVSAVSVALAYAAFALYVAAAPLRGVTPADGAPAPGPDLVLILVGAAFGAAAVLLIVGEAD